MKVELNEKCKGCSCTSLATQTFCNISALLKSEWRWFCIADMGGECLDGGSMNVKIEV